MSSECSICLDTINLEDEIITTECNHIFHGNCILTWIKIDNQIKEHNCPYCRKPICNNYIYVKYQHQLQKYTVTQKTKHIVACKKYIDKLLVSLNNIISTMHNTSRFIKYYKNIFSIVFNITNDSISDINIRKIQEQLYHEYNITFKPLEILKLFSDTMMHIKHEIILNINDDNCLYLEQLLLDLDNIERDITNKQRKKEKQQRINNDRVLSEMRFGTKF